MRQEGPLRLAILYPGDRAARDAATPDKNRFSDLFRAFVAKAVHVEPAVYHDDFCEEVRAQLLGLDGVLVWSNPVEGDRDRSVLDAMLRQVAAAGVFVSTRPDTILKLGTKEILYRSRDMGWGCDTQLYLSMAQMREELPARLASGQARVLKQYRGSSGDGVWKVQWLLAIGSPTAEKVDLPGLEDIIQVRHAKRGCVEEAITLAEFLDRCETYFAGDGRMVDQPYQERLPEGMIRCYLVLDRVAGFGHQAINALFPAPAGAPPSEAPQPGPRLYHPARHPDFQALKSKLERDWVIDLQNLMGIDRQSLPILWDCDFLLGAKDANGEDSYVLCEINVSSVAPYPESAVPHVVDATILQLQTARQKRARLV